MPTTWGKGKILGLKARGDYEMDIEGENNQLKHAAIRSYNGQIPKVRVMGKLVKITNNPKIAFAMIEGGK